MKYLLKNGTYLSEEELQELFRKNNFVIFNERDFNNWKWQKIEQGIIKIKVC